MVFRSAGLLLLVSSILLAQSSATVTDQSSDAPDETPPPAVCPAGGPIGAIHLTVRPPQSTETPLPVDKIANLSEGDSILYSPLIRGREVRHGEVALVLVPVKHDSGDAILVTDPKPADKPQEWKVDQTMSIAAFVYGPSGLSKKKVKNFLSQDELLIAQLADYAEKTSQTEALVAALQDANSSADSVNAALNGFAAQYGVTVPIDRTAPVAVQAQTLFTTMNPQLATYDPLVPSSSARVAQTASLAAAAASLFFGNPIGLAAGGTAMVLDLRSIAFPGTQFRSAFAQPEPVNPRSSKSEAGLNLCGQRTPAPPHTRVAYIWANRIPNAEIPKLQIGSAHFILEGQKTPVPVDLTEKDWKYLDRAREWSLADENGKATTIKVLKLANQKSIEIDLTKAKVAPGDYHLSAYWDWKRFDANGTISVRPESNLRDARLEASSQDRLLAHSGKIAVTLEDADFEFTNKVEIKKSNDEFAKPEPVPFLLPKGLRQGPQQHMDIQIDSANLDPGNYQLLVSDATGKPQSVPIKVLPSPPEISNLPILANEGATSQHFVLKGQHLGLLARLEATGAKLTLDPAWGNDTERDLTVQLTSGAKPGSRFAVSAYVKDRTEPVMLPDALKITGPLPLIASSRLSLPDNFPIYLNANEFPAGSTLTAVLDVKNVGPRSLLRISCEGDTQGETDIAVGEQSDKWSVQQLSPDQLFLSFDTSKLPAGCLVQAVIDNRSGGRSEPYALAHLIRFPKIEQLAPTTEVTQDGRRIYQLTGSNLEMLERAGWDQLSSYDVTGLPAPIAGEGQRQSLRISLPDPPTPASNLYVWLRGDRLGRGTNVTITPLTPPNVPATTTPTAAPQGKL
ncbi:MAG TPA: hypothetical protein VH351_21815 [Bryobacteraceae bacterium]|nr:hypothetical protein [Bryobacteraceae bacterium]